MPPSLLLKICSGCLDISYNLLLHAREGQNYRKMHDTLFMVFYVTQCIGRSDLKLMTIQLTINVNTILIIVPLAAFTVCDENVQYRRAISEGHREVASTILGVSEDWQVTPRKLSTQFLGLSTISEVPMRLPAQFQKGTQKAQNNL